MGIVGISRETKRKLLETAQNGGGIEPWLFQFILTDQEFQSVLIQAAETHGNTRFLECLRLYKEEQLAKAAAARANAKPPQAVAKQSSPSRQGNPSRNENRRKPHPHKGWRQAPHGHASKPEVPAPRITVMRTAGDIENPCPKCGVGVPNKAMQDHLDMACKFRGQSDDWKKVRGTPWSGPSYDGHWRPF
jgi:hypothetical protein